MNLRDFILMACLAGAPAFAAEAPPPIADFARDPEFVDVAISPDGALLATTRMVKAHAVLQILRLKDQSTVGTFGLGDKRDVGDLYWPNNHTVMFGMVERLGTLGLREFTNDLMAVEIDGSKPRTLIAPERNNLMRMDSNRRQFEIVSMLRNDDDHILVKNYERDSFPFLQKINVDTGVRSNVMQAKLRWADFLADRDGNVRFMTGNEKDETLVVQGLKNGSWEELGRYPPGKGALYPLSFGASNEVYFSGNVDEPTRGLFRLDIEKGEQTLLFRDAEFDVSGVIPSREPGKPLGVRWYGAREEWQFFDSKHPDAVAFQQLRQSLGNRDMGIVDFDDARHVVVISAVSDVSPLTYYAIDLDRKAVLAKLPTRPWIQPAQMSPMKPVEFMARDKKTKIHGYLTLPTGRGPNEKLPMIVIPHGGPHHVRDEWEFDPEVQLLASRGYAVLQPNFRGSSGYGRDFANAGAGEWARDMETDVIDAARWAIERGYADPSRMCIYGASYGAYAALVAVEQEPAMFRCAVGYAGLYDLVKHVKDQWLPESQAFYARTLGTDMADIRDRSATTHADKIQVPVLLVHGDDDEVCPIGQFKAMRSALKDARRPFEEMVKDDEGHGFASPKNREDFYVRLLAFLDANTKPVKAP